MAAGPLMLIAAGVQAVGTIMQASAAAGAANYNAGIAAYNEKEATYQGEAAAILQKQQAEKQIGQIVANTGSSGLSMSGSPLDVLQESSYNAEMDNLTTKYNAKIKAEGFQMQEGLDKSQASNDVTGGYFSASSQLLSGAGNYYKYSAGTAVTGNS